MNLLQGMLMQFTEQQQDKLNKVQLDESWKTSLSEFLLSQKMDNLREFLQQEKLAEKTIYPPGKQIFSALNTTPLNEVKVVILGQDPYHGPNQANGLSFSVNDGVRFPPSLQNIYKELHSDLGIEIPKSGDLKKK